MLMHRSNQGVDLETEKNQLLCPSHWAPGPSRLCLLPMHYGTFLLYSIQCRYPSRHYVDRCILLPQRIRAEQSRLLNYLGYLKIRYVKHEDKATLLLRPTQPADGKLCLYRILHPHSNAFSKMFHIVTMSAVKTLLLFLLVFLYWIYIYIIYINIVDTLYIHILCNEYILLFMLLKYNTEWIIHHIVL